MKPNPAQTLTEIAHKVHQLEHPSDVEDFFRSFFTPKECQTLADRYELIRMLLDKVPQREISDKLGVSISQISRGSAELQFGVGRALFPKIFPK